MAPLRLFPFELLVAALHLWPGLTVTSPVLLSQILACRSVYRSRDTHLASCPSEPNVGSSCLTRGVARGCEAPGLPSGGR